MILRCNIEVQRAPRPFTERAERGQRVRELRFGHCPSFTPLGATGMPLRRETLPSRHPHGVGELARREGDAITTHTDVRPPTVASPPRLAAVYAPRPLHRRQKAR